MSKSKEETKKKDEKDNKTKEEKLENLKKEDLLVKYSDEKQQFKKKQEDNNKEIKAVTDKIEQDEKIISEYSQKNKKLYHQLEELRKEVDEKIDHVSTKKIAEKESASKQKSSPYEKILVIKEKELKNVTKLITILKKDKENLTKDLNERADLNKVLELENRYKSLEQENAKYLNEINMLKRMKEEHKRCPEIVKSNELDIKTLKEEVYQLKQKDMEISKKLDQEVEHNEKTKSKLEVVKTSAVTQRNECNKLVEEFNSNIEKSRSSKRLTLKRAEQSGEKSPEKEYHPYFQQYNPIKAVEVNKKEQKKKNKKLFAKDDTTIQVKLPELGDKRDNSLMASSSYLNKSLATTRIDPENEVGKLFNEKERKYLLKRYPEKEVEKFESTFNESEKARVEAYKKYKQDMHEANTKLTSVNESVKLINLEFKENEQKNKLYNYQLNEYKTEQSILTKKIQESQDKVKALNQMLKEKENENSMLYTQVMHYEKLKQMQEEKMLREMKRRKKLDKEKESDESGSKQKSREDSQEK